MGFRRCPKVLCGLCGALLASGARPAEWLLGKKGMCPSPAGFVTEGALGWDNALLGSASSK